MRSVISSQALRSPTKNPHAPQILKTPSPLSRNQGRGSRCQGARFPFDFIPVLYVPDSIGLPGDIRESRLASASGDAMGDREKFPLPSWWLAGLLALASAAPCAAPRALDPGFDSLLTVSLSD